MWYLVGSLNKILVFFDFIIFLFINFIYRYHARCKHGSCHLLKRIHKKKEFRRWHRNIIKEKLIDKEFEVEEVEFNLREWNFMEQELFKYFGGEIEGHIIRTYIASARRTEHLQDIANKIYNDLYMVEDSEGEDQ
jgi:disulfide oxidoreductase YuzD